MEPFCTVSQAYSHFEPFQAVFYQSPSLPRTNPGMMSDNHISRSATLLHSAESLVIGDLIVFFQEQREQPLQLILDDASAGDA